MDAKASVRAQVLAARDALPASVRAEKSARICRELERLLDERAIGSANAGSAAGAADAAAAESPNAPIAARPLVTAFSCMGSEVDVAPFVRAAFERGARVAYPCMVKNPAWTGAGCDIAMRASGEDDTEKPSGKRDAAGASEPASFTPRLLMQFREVSCEQFEAGTVPFIVKPLRSFALDDPELEPYPLVGPEQVDFAVCPLVAFDAAGSRLGYGGGNYDGFLSRVRPDALVVGVGFAEQEVPAGTIPLEPHDLPLPRIVSA